MPNILGNKLQEMSDFYNKNKLENEKFEDFFIRYCEDKIDLNKTNLDFIVKCIIDDILLTKNNYSLKIILKELAEEKNIPYKDIVDISYNHLKEDIERKQIEMQNMDIKKIMDKLYFLIEQENLILNKNTFDIYNLSALILLLSLEK